MAKVHHTAIIEDGAQIGAEVVIEPYAFISAQAKIGDGCTIKQGRASSAIRKSARTLKFFIRDRGRNSAGYEL